MLTWLYYDFEKALRLPWYSDKASSVRTIAETYAREVPLMASVMRGETTFEATVEPIVTENLKLTFPYYNKGEFRSETFQTEAKSIIAKMERVLTITDFMTKPPSFPWIFFTVQACAPSVIINGLLWMMTGFESPMLVLNQPVSWWAVLYFTGATGLVYSLLINLKLEVDEMRSRRQGAEQLNECACFLDEIFTKLRNNEMF